METRLVFFLILLFSPFSTLSREPVSGPIVYIRDQLLALSSTAVPVPDVPRELKRRRQSAVPELLTVVGEDATDPSSCLSSWGT